MNSLIVLMELPKLLGILVMLLFLVFVTINAAFGLYFWINRKTMILPKQKKTMSKYRQIYPHLSINQIYQLLDETWSLRMNFDSFTHFAEKRPYKTKYVNVTPFGFRETASPCRWPLNKKHFNVFFVGGSTTFGYGVQDSETIPAYFQKYATNAKKNKVTVYNFGRGFYFSTQERILIQKLVSENIIPDLVVFLDGINDFLLVDGEPADLRSMKAFFEGSMDWSRLICEFAILRRLPLIRYLQQRNNIKSDQNQQRKSVALFKKSASTTIKKTALRYLNSIKIMDCISCEFGFNNLFVFQPSPYYKAQPSSHHFYKPQIGSLLFGQEYQQLGYTYMAGRRREIEAKHNFLWLADIQESFPKNLYCDGIHYSPEFNQIIAKRIFQFCDDKGLIQLNHLTKTKSTGHFNPRINKVSKISEIAP